MKKLAILSIICLLAPAFSAGAVETMKRKRASTHVQKTGLTRPAVRPAGCPFRLIASGPKPILARLALFQPSKSRLHLLVTVAIHPVGSAGGMLPVMSALPTADNCQAVVPK